MVIAQEAYAVCCKAGKGKEDERLQTTERAEVPAAKALTPDRVPQRKKNKPARTNGGHDRRALRDRYWDAIASRDGRQITAATQACKEADMGELLHCTKANVSAWENGYHQPSFEQVLADNAWDLYAR